MKNINSCIVLLILILTACKSVKLPQEGTMVEIPKSYISLDDTTTIAKIRWSDFFIDDKLKALIAEGISKNLDLQNAMQNIEIAIANHVRTKGMLLPNVTAGTNAGMYKYGDYTQEWAGNKTTEMLPGQIIPQHLPNYFIGFMASWEVDIWGKMKDQTKAAQARFFSSLDAKNFVQTNLISAIANAYYELVALDNQIDILKQNISIQEKSLEIVKLLKQTGRSNELAVKQFEAQIINTKSEAKLVEQIIVEYENIINVLLSRFPQPIERNKDALSTPISVSLSAGIPSQIIQSRPDIRLAEQELIATRFDTKIAKKAFYPTLNLDAGLGLNGFSPTLLFSLPSAAYNILGGLTAPIFNRTALKSEFKTATAIQLTALNNYQQAIITAFAEVYNELKKINNLQERFNLKSSEVEMLDTVVQNADLLYQTNRADYLEVLVAQQSALQAKLDLQDISKLQKQSVVNLYKSLGGGQ